MHGIHSLTKRKLSSLTGAAFVFGLLALSIFSFWPPAEFRAQSYNARGCPHAMFDKSARVFDAITICGTSAVPMDKLAHAAHVAAQWLDNDADGRADNPAVNAALREQNATLVMSSEGLGLYAALIPGGMSSQEAFQDLYAYETSPEAERDAAQEEIHHLIIGFGWAKAFGEVFDDQSTSSAIHAAWVKADAAGYYAYDDSTCNEACKVMEFTYKATAAYLGSAADLADTEFTLKSRTALRENLPDMVAIFESSDYTYPTVAWPDGSYAHPDHISFDHRLATFDVKGLTGHKIAYAAPGEGDSQDIWMMEPDGTRPVNLTATSGSGTDIYPEWSPDARYLYYTSNKHGNETLELYRVNTTGTPKVERLSKFGREVRSLSVSPENRHIVLGLMTAAVPIGADLRAYSADLYVLAIDVLEKRLAAGQLVDIDDMTLIASEPADQHFWHEQPDWQPKRKDEEAVILYSRTQHYDNDPITVEEIWQIRLDGSGHRRVLQNASMPRWTADGRAFTTHEFQFVDFETGTASFLNITGLSPEAGAASLSPDGTLLLFETTDTARLPGLSRISRKPAGASFAILSDHPAYEPRWSPVPVPVPVETHANKEAGYIK